VAHANVTPREVGRCPPTGAHVHAEDRKEFKKIFGFSQFFAIFCSNIFIFIRVIRATAMRHRVVIRVIRG